jgi:hypothetical protein
MAPAAAEVAGGADTADLGDKVRMCALVLTRHFKKYSSKFQRLNELL